jgi:AcrR family transcriptional regulator
VSAVDGIRVPTQARAIRTRAALVEAAQVEFSERGYGSTTARSIAKRAGVATGSFYQYFTDKDQILRELGRSRFERIQQLATQFVGGKRDPNVPDETLERELRSRMRSVVEAVTGYHREDPGLHQVLTERRHSDAELEELTASGERALVSQIARLLEGWGFPGDCQATAFVIFGMVEGTVHSHVLEGPMVSDDRLFDALVDAMVKTAKP